MTKRGGRGVLHGNRLQLREILLRGKYAANNFVPLLGNAHNKCIYTVLSGGGVDGLIPKLCKFAAAAL